MMWGELAVRAPPKDYCCRPSVLPGSSSTSLTCQVWGRGNQSLGSKCVICREEHMHSKIALQ